MPVRKILVATDFSDASRIALARAAALAMARSAELVVVHVFDPARYRTSLGRAVAADALAEEQNAVRLLLEAVRDQIGPARARAATLLLEGYPDEEIVEAARTQAADLIVVGAHGRAMLERLLVGSTADKVVRMSETAVLVARGTPAGVFERILVATDFGPQAERALELAVAVAAPGAAVDLLHVIDIPAAGGEIPLALDPAVLHGIEAEARRRGAEAIAPHRQAKIDVRFDCATGAARETIVRRAGVGYDLVALGSRGRRGLKRFLLGSVAESVMRQAPCSVLISK